MKTDTDKRPLCMHCGKPQPVSPVAPDLAPWSPRPMPFAFERERVKRELRERFRREDAILHALAKSRADLAQYLADVRQFFARPPDQVLDAATVAMLDAEAKAWHAPQAADDDARGDLAELERETAEAITIAMLEREHAGYWTEATLARVSEPVEPTRQDLASQVAPELTIASLTLRVAYFPPNPGQYTSKVLVEVIDAEPAYDGMWHNMSTAWGAEDGERIGAELHRTIEYISEQILADWSAAAEQMQLGFVEQRDRDK